LINTLGAVLSILVVTAGAGSPDINASSEIRNTLRVAFRASSEANPTVEGKNLALQQKLLTGGTWGGKHARLDVKDNQTTLEFDCAHATSPAIRLDQKGRFAVTGRYVEEHGGPIRQGSEQSYAVRLKGVVKGRSMKLTVMRTDTKELIGTFSLIEGEESELVKCR
jgi:hypothetical protein